MQDGGVFLIDEISLAEDSVLERLNSVLESERTLLVPERPEKQEEEGRRKEGRKSKEGEGEGVEIEPKEGFCIVGTMNPGGDFGKRELTPALRNRFTEVWTESITSKGYLEHAKGMIRDALAQKWGVKEEGEGRREQLEREEGKRTGEERIMGMEEERGGEEGGGIEEERREDGGGRENESRRVELISLRLWEFVKYFNLEVSSQYSLEHRKVTMRDVMGMIDFMDKNKHLPLKDLYFHVRSNLYFHYLFQLDFRSFCPGTNQSPPSSSHPKIIPPSPPFFLHL